MKKKIHNKQRIYLVLVCSVALLGVFLHFGYVPVSVAQDTIDNVKKYRKELEKGYKSVEQSKKEYKIENVHFYTEFFSDTKGERVLTINTGDSAGTDVGGLVRDIMEKIFNVIFTISGTVMVILLAVHGTKMIYAQFGEANPVKIGDAKARLKDIAYGTIILLLSWLILNFVDPGLLQPKFFDNITKLRQIAPQNTFVGDFESGIHFFQNGSLHVDMIYFPLHGADLMGKIKAIRQGYEKRNAESIEEITELNKEKGEKGLSLFPVPSKEVYTIGCAYWVFYQYPGEGIKKFKRRVRCGDELLATSSKESGGVSYKAAGTDETVRNVLEKAGYKFNLLSDPSPDASLPPDSVTYEEKGVQGESVTKDFKSILDDKVGNEIISVAGRYVVFKNKKIRMFGGPADGDGGVIKAVSGSFPFETPVEISTDMPDKTGEEEGEIKLLEGTLTDGKRATEYEVGKSFYYPKNDVIAVHGIPRKEEDGQYVSVRLIAEIAIHNIKKVESKKVPYPGVGDVEEFRYEEKRVWYSNFEETGSGLFKVFAFLPTFAEYFDLYIGVPKIKDGLVLQYQSNPKCGDSRLNPFDNGKKQYCICAYVSTGEQSGFCAMSNLKIEDGKHVCEFRDGFSPPEGLPNKLFWGDDRSLVLLPEDFVYDTYDPGAKSLSAGVKDVGKILYLKPFLYCEEPDKKMYDLGEYTATYSISDLIHSEINNPNKVSPNGRGLLLGF